MLNQQQSSTMPVGLQLTELNLERNKMTKEKVNLENQLEAEQEYILNKLHKQVSPSTCSTAFIASCICAPTVSLSVHCV